MDVCPPDIRFSHYLHSFLHCPSIHLSLSVSPLHHIHPCVFPTIHPPLCPLYSPMSFATPPHIRPISSFMLSSSVSLPTADSLQQSSPSRCQTSRLTIFYTRPSSPLYQYIHLFLSPFAPHPSLLFSSLSDIRWSPFSTLATVNLSKSDYLSWTRRMLESCAGSGLNDTDIQPETTKYTERSLVPNLWFYSHSTVKLVWHKFSHLLLFAAICLFSQLLQLKFFGTRWTECANNKCTTIKLTLKRWHPQLNWKNKTMSQTTCKKKDFKGQCFLGNT